MAAWHDESHLNNWAANNTFIELGPAFCYEPTYPQLALINPIIMAVDKKDSTKKKILETSANDEKLI